MHTILYLSSSYSMDTIGQMTCLSQQLTIMHNSKE